MTINEKLTKLRGLMQQNGVDTYIITKNDPHGSEYAKAYWSGVKFISGFTASMANVVVTLDRAIVWTDSRYTIQAEIELGGTEFETFNIADPENGNLLDFVAKNTKSGGTIGFDSRTLLARTVLDLKSKIGDSGIKLNPNLDLLGEIWENKPVPTSDKVFEHELKYCGVSRAEKIANVREQIKAKNGDVYVISSLDDIAWLFNLRCNDADSNTTFESYAFVSEGKVALFAHPQKIADVKSMLENEGIEVLEYNDAKAYISNEIKGKTVLIAPSKTCYNLYEALESSKIVELDFDITTKMKAVKNSVEIENARNAHLKDGISVTRFMKWIKENVGKTPMNEYTAGEMLDNMRKDADTFVHKSFNTICGYMPNGAIIHYRAEESTALPINPSGVLLVDSGGNYLDGTTDITRTIAMGEVTNEMKEDFTLVLKGLINLSMAKFIKGSTGAVLDVLARSALWDEGKDYKHGTGHGIGQFLSVHEGPQNISSRSTVVLEEGMMISNEPGFYKKDEYGIRSETIILVKPFKETEYGEFLEFETLTMSPFDLELIIKDMLTEKELKWLNDYHAEVYEKQSKYLNEEEKAWLKNATRAI